jgi:hypothetical protein
MAKSIKAYKFSKHAVARFAARGVAEADAIDTVLSPDKKQQQAKGTHGGFRTKFSKKLNDGRTLAVIAELYKNTCYFISAFYE